MPSKASRMGGRSLLGSIPPGCSRQMGSGPRWLHPHLPFWTTSIPNASHLGAGPSVAIGPSGSHPLNLSIGSPIRVGLDSDAIMH